MATLEETRRMVQMVHKHGFCILEGIIPVDRIEFVRGGVIAANRRHRKHTQAITEGKAVEKIPPKTRELVENELARIDPELKASNDRTEKIHMLDGVCAKLRESGVNDLYEIDGTLDRAPLPKHEIANFPAFADHLCNPRLLNVVRGVLDPHVRCYQLEFGKVLQPNASKKATMDRGWHTDPPHDLSYPPGAVTQPFPDACISLVTVWYLVDVDAERGGTFVLPGSHRDARNPRGPDNNIDQRSPIPGEFQVVAKAGSVLVQDTRIWHSMAANPSAQARVGCVARFCPWWINANGNLTSRRLTSRQVPRNVFRVLHPAAQQLLRHVAEGEEDRMTLEKQIWGYRASKTHQGRRGSNAWLTDYVESSRLAYKDLYGTEGTFAKI